jgi:hypothetical protein
MKTVEVNLGIGMNMFFPETVMIEIDDTFEKRHKKYLKFIKTLEEPDYDYVVDDPNQNKVREYTFEEFVESWENSKTLQKKFK